MGKLPLKPQGNWTLFGHLKSIMTHFRMSVTQTRMCQLVVNQNDEMLCPHVAHAPKRARMEYGVEMSSLYLDLAKCSEWK